MASAQAMDEANRLYDRQEHDVAQEAALKVPRALAWQYPMLRIVVTTACMMGETDKAQRHWSELPERDREQMATRGLFGVVPREAARFMAPGAREYSPPLRVACERA